MTLDSWQWQNPEYVLQRKQEQQAAKHKHCGDCLFHRQLKLSEIEHTCEMGRHYGHKCDHYQSTKGYK